MLNPDTFFHKKYGWRDKAIGEMTHRLGSNNSSSPNTLQCPSASKNLFSSWLIKDTGHMCSEKRYWISSLVITASHVKLMQTVKKNHHVLFLGILLLYLLFQNIFPMLIRNILLISSLNVFMVNL